MLALTGDEHYYTECKRKALEAGLYLDEWGLWEWEPDSQSISRFTTSSKSHKKTSLGSVWGSETEEDEGRWIQLEGLEEEWIFDAIGMEHAPPKRRNLAFILAQKKSKRNHVAMMYA